MMYDWQAPQWDQIMRMRDKMPHALLLHGPAGVGKSAFAQHLAQSLLCAAPAKGGHACGTCESCGWVEQYSHPDYRRIRPEILETQAAETDEAEPAAESTAKKTRSKDIKIEQVRGLSRMMSVSTHRAGLRIVLVYPAERMTTEAANALLKTLEEPPEHTLFLLVADRPDQLLPTILSRCRMIAFPMPAREAAQAWLDAIPEVTSGAELLALAGGAPLAAREIAQSDDRADMRTLQDYLCRPDMDGAFRMADKFQRHDLGKVIDWHQRWVYDLFSCKLTGRVRYHPASQQDIVRLAARTDNIKLARALRTLGERRAVSGHPLSQKLVLENMLIDYAGLFARA